MTVYGYLLGFEGVFEKTLYSPTLLNEIALCVWYGKCQICIAYRILRRILNLIIEIHDYV